jgi:hypothetical protein
MVRRGSTVRVRQRALQKPRKEAVAQTPVSAGFVVRGGKDDSPSVLSLEVIGGSELPSL